MVFGMIPPGLEPRLPQSK